MTENPTAGARWLHVPGGMWFRWSHLGEDWQRVEVPPMSMPIEAAGEMVPVEWLQHRDGTWERIGEHGGPLPGPGRGAFLDEAPPDGMPSLPGILLRHITFSYIVTLPVLATGYLLLWMLSLILNIITGIMSPWLFDEPSAVLPLTWWTGGWIVAASVPVGIGAGLIRAQGR